MVSRRGRRDRTSAYSPMTKKALSAMSSAVRTRSSAVIAERAVSRYFEEDRLARAAVGGGYQSSRRSDEPVDPARHLEVVRGEAALAVIGERQAHDVPVVDEDVGVVVGRLGRVRDLVDEGHRTLEVVELELPDDGVVLTPPLAALQALVDLVVAQPCHTLPPGRCGSSASCPMRPSCSSRSGWATMSSLSRTSVTFPARSQNYRTSPATCWRPASARPRSTPPCASAPSRA